MRRSRLRHPATSQAGFTLIEIMVATLLLLVVMAGFIPFFLSGLERSSSARYTSAATNIARQMMEEIRQLDYREIQQNSAQPSDPANLSNKLPTTHTLRGTSFNIAYAVENSTSGGGQLKKVTVTVSWTGKPEGQTAVVTSLIHQQFLGPRGSLLELTPGGTSDPRGTPFKLIADSQTAKYYIAEADWGLVYDNINNASTRAARNVYLRLAFVNDAGLTIPLGDAASDYKIPKSALNLTIGADGSVQKVYFQHAFNCLDIPDGYWELQAVAFNEYDQPGNLWRLRVRIDHSPPDPPASMLAVAGSDDQSILVSWVPGDEGDRDHWVLQRRKQAGDGSWPEEWNTLTTLAGTASSYTDLGNAAAMTDPWGSLSDGVTNYYQYRLWAVDWAGNAGTAGTTQEQVPTLGATTTTISGTTTTISGTTTTAATTTTTAGPVYYSVTVRDNTTKAYDVTVRNAANEQVFSGRVGKNGGTLAITGLAAGSYQLRAVEVVAKNARTIDTSFSVPLQAGTIVLDIF